VYRRAVDFGRLPSIDDVPFDLPPLDPRSELALGETPAPAAAVRIGAPAWASRAFARKLYPKGTKPGDFLARYAERFDAIELNATFHRVPHQDTVEAWRDATPERFRFCPKLHRPVAEQLDVEGTRRFCDVVARFGGRLGPMLLQLGPSITPKRLGDIERVLEAAPGRAIAVEFRHRSWFEAGRLRDDAFRMLSARGATAVITDVAGRRDVCHGSLTSRTAYVRFQGNELHPTDAVRLDAWAARFDEMSRRGVEAVYFFVHQPDDALAPETLALLAERLGKQDGGGRG